MIVLIIVSPKGPLQHPPLEYNLAGILVIGGYPSQYAVEFWSSTNADQGSCQLSDYPRKISQGPTVSLVANRLVVDSQLLSLISLFIYV